MSIVSDFVDIQCSELDLLYSRRFHKTSFCSQLRRGVAGRGAVLLGSKSGVQEACTVEKWKRILAHAALSLLEFALLDLLQRVWSAYYVLHLMTRPPPTWSVSCQVLVVEREPYWESRVEGATRTTTLALTHAASQGYLKRHGIEAINRAACQVYPKT